MSLQLKKSFDTTADRSQFSFFKPTKPFVSNSQRQVASFVELAEQQIKSFEQLRRNPEKFRDMSIEQLEALNRLSQDDLRAFTRLDDANKAARNAFITNTDESQAEELAQAFIECAKELDAARTRHNIRTESDFGLPNPAATADVSHIERDMIAAPAA